MNTPQGPIRLFRVRYTWRRFNKQFTAHTVWGGFSVEQCKQDFARRNPHVTAFRVEEEVL